LKTDWAKGRRGGEGARGAVVGWWWEGAAGGGGGGEPEPAASPVG